MEGWRRGVRSSGLSTTTKNKQTKKKRVSFLKSTLLLMLFVEISMSQVHLGIAKIVFSRHYLFIRLKTEEMKIVVDKLSSTSDCINLCNVMIISK